MKTARLCGVEATLVEIDVKTTGAFPAFDSVGWSEQGSRELRVRVRSAIRESGYAMPDRRVIVHATGGDGFLDTQGDLVAALGVLGIDDESWLVVGELSLSGELRPIRGVAAYAELAAKEGLTLVCPTANLAEAAPWGVPVIHGRNLMEVVEGLGTAPEIPLDVNDHWSILDGRQPCWSDVRGQQAAKDVLEACVLAGLNVAMVGPPGAGKTMLARRLPTIMEPLADDAAREATKIHSVAGLLPGGVGLLRQRPFRAPHYTASAVSLVGGGGNPRPGEVSLAHGGVLFLDELPEFPLSVVETLGRTIADKEVVIERTRGRVVFPAKFLTVVGLNPCPCGWDGSVLHPCNDRPALKEAFKERSSKDLAKLGIEVVVPLTPVPPRLMSTVVIGETSAEVRAKLAAAKDVFHGLMEHSNTDALTRLAMARAAITGDTNGCFAWAKACVVG